MPDEIYTIEEMEEEEKKQQKYKMEEEEKKALTRNWKFLVVRTFKNHSTLIVTQYLTAFYSCFGENTLFLRKGFLKDAINM